MSIRIQVVLDADEREAFRRSAAAEGQSLSAWLREAGRQRMSKRTPGPMDNIDALRAFFADLAEDDVGREPDWEQHLGVIAASRSQGAADG